MDRRDVEEAMKALESAGTSVTVRSIIAHMGGGSFRDVSRLLRAIRDGGTSQSLSAENRSLRAENTRLRAELARVGAWAMESYRSIARHTDEKLAQGISSPPQPPRLVEAVKD